MQARMKNPAMALGAMEPVQALFKAVYADGVEPATLELVHLRASRINGCSACVDSGARSARKAGETDERLATVAAWREAPYFSDAERAAVAPGTGPLLPPGPRWRPLSPAARVVWDVMFPNTPQSIGHIPSPRHVTALTGPGAADVTPARLVELLEDGS